MNTFALTRKIPIAIIGVSLGVMFSDVTLAQSSTVSKSGSVSVFTLPTQANQATNLADIANAKPLPLPQANVPTPDINDRGFTSQATGTPGFEPGSPGNGIETPVKIPFNSDVTNQLLLDGGDIEPQEYGTQEFPFTTMRVDTNNNNAISKTYPFSAAGKLYFKIGTASYICSASLIKRGVIVTAAHCVSEFGKNKIYSGFQFVPAHYAVGSTIVAPYGIWTAATVYVKTSYLNGSDPCHSSSPGVVCQNDVAVIRLSPKTGAFPGTSTGWFGYGYGGSGFTPTGKLALINQLGYPKSHDQGLLMQRTDAQGFTYQTYVNNTIWGSRMTGGSSGGPELVNLGIRPVLVGTTFGSGASPNMVIGVTSWGPTSTSPKYQGASPFLSTNIGALVTAACTGQATLACKP